MLLLFVIEVFTVKAQNNSYFRGKWNWEGSKIQPGFNSGTSEIYKDSLYIYYDGNPAKYLSTLMKIEDDTLIYQFYNGIYDIDGKLWVENNDELAGIVTWPGGESPVTFIRIKNHN
jgi:hypothetical protein